MTPSAWIAIMGLLIFGTIISLTAKIIYEIPAIGLNPEVHKFEKPWFQTMVMFAGMTFCFPLHIWKKSMDRRREEDPERAPLKPIVPDSERHHLHNAKKYWLALAPAMADLVGTALMMTGLLFTTVSVNQMLRGAELVFCALLSIVFLKRKLDRYNWIGMILCVIGISLVGLAGIVAGSEQAGTDPDKQFLGFMLIVGAQMVQASQVVIEEFLLQDLEMEPLQIVGWEGIWGTGVSCAIALPIVYFIPGPDCGSFENAIDAILMIKNSWVLIGVEVLDTTGMLLYNYFAMCVTSELSAMHRTVLETLRTLFAWLVDLSFYYVFTDGTLGENWNRGSYVQLVGFAILVAGTIIYNHSEYYEETSDKALAVEYHPAVSYTQPASQPSKATDTNPMSIGVNGATPAKDPGLVNVKTSSDHGHANPQAGLKPPSYRRTDFSGGGVGSLYGSSLKRVSHFSPR